ncbi:MAG: GAF domain-containing protein [Thermodesulfobacteriota bacterium]
MAETEAVLSASLFAALYDPWPDPCLLLTRDGEVVAANRAAGRMAGLAPGAMVGRPLAELVGDPAEAVAAYLDLCFRNRQQIPGSLSCRTADGETVRYRGLGYRLEGATPGAPLIFLRCCRLLPAGNRFGTLNRQLEQQQTAQRALKASLARLKVVLDSVEALVYVADMQSYEVLFINQYGQELLGDITGKICWQAIQQGQSGPCAFCTNKYLLTPEGQPGEVYVWDFQNTRTGRWFHIHDRAIVWGDGRIVRLEVATDITDRRAVEEALRRDEARTEALLHLAQFSWVTRDQLADEALEQAVRLSGSTVGYLHFLREDEQTIELMSWSRAVAAQCAAAKLSHYPLANAGIWADCIRQRQPVIHNDYPNTPGRRGYPEGHFPLLRHLSVPVFDQGRIVAVVGVGNKEEPYEEADARQLLLFTEGMWQILERREAEVAIRAAKERWEQTFDAIDEVVTIHDPEMRIVQANKFAGATFGVEPAALLGRYCHEVFRGQAVPCPGCPERESQRDYGVHSAAITCERLQKTFEVTVFPMLTDGVLQGFVHIAKDVTEQRLMEEHLRQVQKMEAMGTLAGGIAHDFNNILSPILGYAELAQTRLGANDPLAGDLRQIVKAANRAKELVQQILTFSRRAEHAKKPLQPQLLVKEALKLLRASLPSTIEIRQEIPVDCGTIMGDPTQLHQVVMNLCTNAFHAMRATGGVLAVRMARIEIGESDLKVAALNLAAGPYVLLEVSDTGCGMDQETMARIFEPYFTTKAKGEGTGLGLSVVHGIVKAAGGHITVYSEPGQGTTFHVYLPAVEAAAPAAAVVHEALPEGAERVLVVDDEAEVGDLLRSMLEYLGYRVRVLASSQEALAVIEQAPDAIDLLITDMTMPAMTGLELAGRVLAIRPGLPIVLCTGFSELVSREKALGLGLREFLMKPVTMRDLAYAVRRALAPRP